MMDKNNFLTLDFKTEQFIQACLALPEFAYIAQVMSKKTLDWFVVGGSIRDYVLSNQLPSDIDIVLHPKWVDAVIKGLCQELNMRIVPLDKDLGIYRAIHSKNLYYFDIAAMQGDDIEVDLSRRDLSMNAVAINIYTSKLIDPYEGLLAIYKKQIDAISEQNFIDDPLRMLRAYRFFAQLPDFEITVKTTQILRTVSESRKASLQRIAIERIHDELGKLILGPNALDALTECVEQKVLLSAFPGFSQPVWKQLVSLFKLAGQLEASLWAALIRDPILFLWMGLVSINQVQLSNFTILLERYKWSQHQRSIILRVMTFLSQNDSPEITDDFFDSLGHVALPYWILAYMSMSLYQVTEAELPDTVINAWLDRYNNIWELGLDFLEREKNIPKLLTGSDLVKYFNRESGPWVGAALSLLRSAQRQGKVQNYKEALDFLRLTLANESPKEV